MSGANGRNGWHQIRKNWSVVAFVLAAVFTLGGAWVTVSGLQGKEFVEQRKFESHIKEARATYAAQSQLKDHKELHVQEEKTHKAELESINKSLSKIERFLERHYQQAHQ